MIPAQAVEAAAYALYLDANQDTEVQWFDIGFHDQDELMRTATKALEASAPHMLAAALKLADKWQADFPYKAQELRSALGVTND